MRIGEVNKDNYKQFLSMLGAKSNKNLDAIMNGGKAGNEEISIIEAEKREIARLIKTGQIEEGMVSYSWETEEDFNKWRKTVPVSDEVRDKLIETARKHLLDLANGIKPNGVEERTNDISTIMKDYRKNIPPSERLAVTWTLSHIYTDEQARLINYVKSKIPSWNYGQAFDKNILLNSDFGTKGIDIKA
jgi:hypothetical protein